ncbi:(d)CMP kinase, partial [bacterium]|nr:(d)CMP kinase [bacterium]
MSKKLVIAIDGPAGSGKSTVAKLVADKLGYLYLNTGAMYRAVTLKALNTGINLGDEAALIYVAENCVIEFADGGAKTLLDRVDVSDEIHLPIVDKVISDVVKISGVRRAMVVQQQRIGKQGGVVAEGRDVTTVVFPNADVKIYLNASLQERAKRRYTELKEKGEGISLREVEADMLMRDEKDSSREDSPLRVAEDATVIDTTNLTIGGVVEAILALMEIEVDKCDEPDALKAVGLRIMNDE